jgi:hypothetical protein
MVLAERGSCPQSGSEAKGTEGSDCPDLEILGVIKTQHFMSFQEPFTFL